MTAAPAATAKPAVTWDWPSALHTAAAVTPAVILIAAGRVPEGVAAAIGILPTGLIGLGGTGRSRLTGTIIGIAFAAGILTGSLLAPHLLVSVAGLFLLPLAASILAARHRLGTIALIMIAPSVAVGLSFTGPRDALPLATMITAGSLWSGLLAWLWPLHASPPPPKPPAMPRPFAWRYGILLGAAAATATATSALLHLPHKGWAATAALLVMRPNRDLLTLRGAGRATATLTGAFTGYLLLTRTTPAWIYAVLAAAAAIAAIATRASRWYLTSAATSFLVLILSLYATTNPDTIRATINGRILQNVYGVAIAYLFGAVIPAALSRKRDTSTSNSTDG